jgi:hypothetical protein
VRLLPALLLLLLPMLGGAGLVQVPVDTASIDGSMAARKLALVIGVSEYEDPMLTPLAFARADAEGMSGVLAAPEYGGFDDVRTVVGREATTSAGITQALERLLSVAGPEDTVLVYLSGHGTLDLDWQQQPDLFLASSDTRTDDLPKTGLRVRELQDLLGSSNARRKVLIIDACHHGAGKSKVAPETIARLRGLKGAGTPLLREPEQGFEAHLFASTFGLPALEDPVLGHGVYTHYLMEAMSAQAELADRDGDRLVSVSEAHDWARDQTIAHTAAVQVPRAEYKIVGREQIFLSGDESDRRAAQQAMLFTFDDYYLRCAVRVDGRDMGLLPRGVTLSPGEHDVEIQTPSGEILASRRVRVQAGDVVDVASLHAGVKSERLRFGAAGGIYGGFGRQAGDPLGGVLGGVNLSAGVSFPGRKPLRAHARLDVSWHAGRYAVSKAGTEFTAAVHAVRARALFGLHVRAGRFGLVVGPSGGLFSALRFPAGGLGPASPNIVSWEVGGLLEPSLALSDRVSLSLGLGLSVTGADLTGTGTPAPVVYGQVQGGLTWTL